MLTNDHGKRLIKELEAARNGRMLQDVFTDFVRMSALAIESPLTRGEQHRDIEDEFAHIRAGYNDEQYEHIRTALAIVVDALEERRVEFLGTVLEEIGASNVRNGQFFTPPAVGRAMAELTGADLGYTPGKPITVADIAGGSGVLLIEQAEALLKRGIPMGDILVLHGDIDARSCDIAYVQFTMLGYPAIVCHQDGLTGEFYREPMYTLGYYRHCFPMRGIDPMREVKNEETRSNR